MGKIGVFPRPASFISGRDPEPWRNVALTTLDVLAIPCAFLPGVGKPFVLAADLAKLAIEPSRRNLSRLGVDVATFAISNAASAALPILHHARRTRALHALLRAGRHRACAR
jgi:hypothetical protein